MTMWNVTHSGAWIMDRYPGIPGVLSFPDSLTTGPIEDTGDVDAWFERRSRYWRELRTVLSGAGSAQDSELSAEELRTALCANMTETPTSPWFSVEGGGSRTTWHSRR